MDEVKRSVVVEAPLDAVYNEWTRIEKFPLFMKTLKEVRQIGEKQFLWKGERDGIQFESVAEVTLEIPHHRLAWRNTSGQESSGVVCFEKHGEGTRITFKVKSAANDGAESTDALEQRLDQILQNFKSLIETGAC